MNRDNHQRHDSQLPSSHDVDKILQHYFLKKGFSHSELAYIQESSQHLSLEELVKKFDISSTVDLPDHVQLIKQDQEQGGGDLDATAHSFENFREWILNALDVYKVSSCQLYLDYLLSFTCSMNSLHYSIPCLFTYFLI